MSADWFDMASDARHALRCAMQEKDNAILRLNEAIQLCQAARALLSKTIVSVLDSRGYHLTEVALGHQPKAGEIFEGVRELPNHITPAPYKAYYDAARGAFIEYPF